jgi:hypothetical protein
MDITTLSKEERRKITNKIYYLKRTNNKKYIEYIKKYRNYNLNEDEENDYIKFNKLSNIGQKQINIINDKILNFINLKANLPKEIVDNFLSIEI